jgi:phytoene dehydrogenase-like protein
MGTIQLASPKNFFNGYVDSIKRWNDPAARITVHFASQKPLASCPFLALIGKARRMVYAGNFSASELQRAPKGWYLYCGASVPIPARGQFDVENETALLLEDLRDQFPGFDEAKILTVDVTAHEWPAQRAVSGFDQSQNTPIANLFNVGNGVKPWASGGTAACAESARIVTERITKMYPL